MATFQNGRVIDDSVELSSFLDKWLKTERPDFYQQWEEAKEEFEEHELMDEPPYLDAQDALKAYLDEQNRQHIQLLANGEGTSLDESVASEKSVYEQMKAGVRALCKS